MVRKRKTDRRYGIKEFAGGEDEGYFDDPMVAGSIPATALRRVAQW